MIEKAMVTTDWLAGHLGDPGLRVVDGSMYLPGSGRDAAAEFARGHVPGAVFFDVEASSDPRSPLPHMLPSPDRFAERMTALGLATATASWSTTGPAPISAPPGSGGCFACSGTNEWPCWTAGLWQVDQGRTAGGERDAGPEDGRLHRARTRGRAVRDLEQVRTVSHSGEDQIVDMRSAGRFAATEPEPRPGLRGRPHPGKPEPSLQRAGGQGRDHASARGTSPEDRGRRNRSRRPVVATCGSGVSACTLIHALHLLGHDRVALYDGAWSEWGGREDTAVETGWASRPLAGTRARRAAPDGSGKARVPARRGDARGRSGRRRATTWRAACGSDSCPGPPSRPAPAPRGSGRRPAPSPRPARRCAGTARLRRPRPRSSLSGGRSASGSPRGSAGPTWPARRSWSRRRGGGGQQQDGVERADDEQRDERRDDGRDLPAPVRGGLPLRTRAQAPSAMVPPTARRSTVAGRPRSESMAIQSLLGHGLVGMLSLASKDGSPGDMYSGSEPASCPVPRRAADGPGPSRACCRTGSAGRGRCLPCSWRRR